MSNAGLTVASHLVYKPYYCVAIHPKQTDTHRTSLTAGFFCARNNHEDVMKTLLHFHGGARHDRTRRHEAVQ